jgi:hypothetical protein
MTTSGRTTRLHARLKDRKTLTEYLHKHPGSGRRWTRALAIHAQEAGAYGASLETDYKVGPVKRLNTGGGTSEYYARMTVPFEESTIPLWRDSDRCTDFVQSIQNLARQWTPAPMINDPARPASLYVFFVVEYRDNEADKETKTRTLSKIPTLQARGVFESQCTAKLDLLNIKGAYLDWLSTLHGVYPDAQVLAVRIHVWSETP